MNNWSNDFALLFTVICVCVLMQSFTLSLWLPSDSRQLFHIGLLHVGITVVNHHAWLSVFLVRIQAIYFFLVNAFEDYVTKVQWFLNKKNKSIVVRLSLSIVEEANLPLPLSIYKTLNEARPKGKGLSFFSKERWYVHYPPQGEMHWDWSFRFMSRLWRYCQSNWWSCSLPSHPAVTCDRHFFSFTALSLWPFDLSFLSVTHS